MRYRLDGRPSNDAIDRARFEEIGYVLLADRHDRLAAVKRQLVVIGLTPEPLRLGLPHHLLRPVRGQCPLPQLTVELANGGYRGVVTPPKLHRLRRQLAGRHDTVRVVHFPPGRGVR